MSAPPSPFCIERLGKQDRSAFHCGVEPLDRYFHRQVSQDVRRRLSICYIATIRETGEICGFYTLSAASVPLVDAPPDLTRKLPRYEALPAACVGRLAVDRAYRGQRLGGVLLADAAMRAAATGLGVFALIVDAKDASAEAFYRHHGFVAYGSAPGKMLMPMSGLSSLTG